MGQKCSHEGCSNLSWTGIWCEECIENEWRSCAVGDGLHWIGWKVTWQKANNLFIGAFGAPYEVGEVTVPFGFSDWLLSPLGALKEAVKGANEPLWLRKWKVVRIIAAVISKKNVKLISRETALFLRGNSPALVVGAYPVSSFPVEPEKAIALLDGMRDNPFFQEEVDRLERELRPNIPPEIYLPPSIPLPSSNDLQNIRAEIFRRLTEEAENSYLLKLREKLRKEEWNQVDPPLFDLTREVEEAKAEVLRSLRRKTISVVSSVVREM